MIRVSCDRCGARTTKECIDSTTRPLLPGESASVVVPGESVIDTAPGETEKLTKLGHFHICPDCIKGFLAWWKDGKVRMPRKGEVWIQFGCARHHEHPLLDAGHPWAFPFEAEADYLIKDVVRDAVLCGCFVPKGVKEPN